MNLVYSKGQKPSDAVEVPVELPNMENREWGDEAFAYALDSSTIGISGKPTPE